MERQIEGNIIDLYNRQIHPGVISIHNGRICSISKNNNHYDHYIAPGFIDAHVHIESSMLIPLEFSKLVVQKGTVAIVNDPHEIANVLGIPGIQFMIENSKSAFIKMFFTIPSCVPATSFDFSGCKISSSDIEKLLQTGNFIGLSEMMNVPGVIFDDPEIKKIMELFSKDNLLIDGHAPGIKGLELKKYIKAGISTDHECSSLQEAFEKIESGMKILIREGSAAKNYDSLKSLISSHPDQVMFCTDDSHPGDLIHQGHIDKIVRRAVRDGFDLFDVLRIASINPIKHYNLPIGSLRIGDSADFAIFRDLNSFETIALYVNGKNVYESAFSICQKSGDIHSIIESSKNKFKRRLIHIFEISKSVKDKIICIKVLKNEILTEKIVFPVSAPVQNLESDLEKDILKIVYLNRYIENSKPQVAFITGMGLKKGAFATSISHDSHNIIAAGTNDRDLTKAINTVISGFGGLCVVDGEDIMNLPLPIAGIMSDQSGSEVAKIWDDLIEKLKSMGCVLDSPFMTLSFMALIVIPELKIGEQGLFEFSTFGFITE